MILSSAGTRGQMSYMKKNFEELSLIDDFLMNAATSDQRLGADLCRIMLSALLQKELKQVKVITQRIIPALAPGLRGIRMDVEISEYDEKASIDALPINVYDVEPHNQDDIHLPKHNRFYQAKIDSRYLYSGEKDFRKLPNLFVITILNYDPFGYDYMVYHVRNRCEEVPELSYEDGLEFYYFYTNGKKGGSEGIKAMLNYIQNSTEQNATDEATEKVHQYVKQIRVSPEARLSYMTLGDIIDREREEAATEANKAKAEQLVNNIENAMKNFHIDLETACKGLEISMASYEQAKEFISEM